MSGAELTADGTQGRFDPQEHYIRAHLTRPVREGSEGRVKILKTYMDEKSYFSAGRRDRVRAVARHRAQRDRPAEGLQPGVVERRGPGARASRRPAQDLVRARQRLRRRRDDPRAQNEAPRSARRSSVADRNFDFSKTMYDLDAPESHRMSVTHEYVETRPGARARIAFLDRTALTSIAVVDVDSGEALKTTQENGATFATLATAIAKPSQSARIRVTGTLTDPAYTIADSQLAWEQTLRDAAKHDPAAVRLGGHDRVRPVHRQHAGRRPRRDSDLRRPARRRSARRNSGDQGEIGFGTRRSGLGVRRSGSTGLGDVDRDCD